ncbi:hypothetical protein XENTR_v10005081 [Xenopus tropicalis]|nr:hypothetical protein XENTR_v10005081 [Xenopus tropicalis]
MGRWMPSCPQWQKNFSVKLNGIIKKPHKVVGSSGKMYTCFASCHYCSCPAFSFSVLRKNDNMLCKHILAIYLSQAMGLCQELTVTDKQMCDILFPKED